MSFIYEPHPFTPESKREGTASLLTANTYDRDFYVLLIGSILLAICAIFTDSIPVLIASMIVAPLASPIVALGLGITVQDNKVIKKSAAILGVSCIIALALAVVITLTFNGEQAVDKFISFNGNRHIAVIVAVASGAIAAYSTIRPKIASAITGIAIAVSLMPPLVATGIGYASGRMDFGTSAAILFLLNVAGILIASIVVFTLFGIRKTYRS
ncbi:MAG TPA: DUF389 domain-containing protein [Candidatus Saccharimonadales bacterium]|nr:DUF389 domain-containing protein [Candidatus Saccharimonadales bacterium]